LHRVESRRNHTTCVAHAATTERTKSYQWSKKSIWTKTRRNGARKGVASVDINADQASDERIVVSVDMMGGDSGLSAVVGGLVKSARKNPRIGFLLHGDQDKIKPLVAKRKELTEICEIRHTDKTISMDEKPSRAVRQGKGTSMWNAVEAVKKGDANVAVSCGNTGALMAMSMLLLRKAPGVHRPAIAILWPSHNRDMPSDKVDVIVTDGFTGNIAIKTAEGTASLITGLMRQAFKHSIWSRIGALFALTSLKRLAKRVDPRRVNGGVFLGLNGTVIKSHGAADATGVSAAIKLAFQLADGGFEERLAARVASAALSSNDGKNPEEE